MLTVQEESQMRRYGEVPCMSATQVALISKAPTFERKTAKMAALLRSAQFIGRYTSDRAGREARQLELTKHWCVGR